MGLKLESRSAEAQDMTSAAATELSALLASNGVENAESILESMTDDQIASALAGLQTAEAEKAALRQRVMDNPTLRAAVCPATSWETPTARYAVTRRTVDMLDATAARYGVPVDALAQAMIDEHGTVAETIAMFGDPRFDGYVGDSSGFYAVKCRVRDAIRSVTAEADEAKRVAREAARDADWAAKGLDRCDRCGGAGGWKGWPGFTCYDCGGAGAVMVVR